MAILASGCPADDGTAAESDGAGGSTSWMSLPDPTDEEAADLQMRVCEVLAVECAPPSDPAGDDLTIEECLERRQHTYAFSEECRRVRYARDTCFLEAKVDFEASTDPEDPSFEYLHERYICAGLPPPMPPDGETACVPEYLAVENVYCD